MNLDEDRSASREDASESWDDDFEFQPTAFSLANELHDSAANTVRGVPAAPREEESWDDAYEDVEISMQDKARVDPTRVSDADTGSWGSGSDWSGDGDAEDLSHESYTRPSSTRPEPRSRAHPDTAFVHSQPPAPPTSVPMSFFSRISPVKKWKARDKLRSDTSPGSGKEPERRGAKWSRRRGSTTTPTDVVTSESPSLKRVFSSTHLSLALHSRQLKYTPSFSKDVPRPTGFPSPPLTPDLTISPSSTSSPVHTPPSPFSRTLRHNPKRSTSAALIPVPGSIPLGISSTHNLPSTLAQNSPLSTPRRSSLGDLKHPRQLKIPDRIFRTQGDIKRDMNDVKEFATCIEQLKILRHTYALILRDLHDISSSSSPTSSPKKQRRIYIAFSSPQTSPTKPPRKFSFGTPSSPVPDPLARLRTTYGVWWECAELLIALCGPDQDAGIRAQRPRAVTLGSGSSDAPSRGIGPPTASPPSSQRRATTGRLGHGDFTPRQLSLLKGMLAAEAGKGWDPRSAGDDEGRDKVRGGGLGIRDLWRGLRKRGAMSSGDSESASDGSAFALSEDASSPSPSKRTVTATTHGAVPRRRQPTRRPSLAGIFGLGQRAPASPQQDTDSHTGESSGWDAGPDTIRGAVRKRPMSKDGPSPPNPNDRPPSRPTSKHGLPPRPKSKNGPSSRPQSKHGSPPSSHSSSSSPSPQKPPAVPTPPLPRAFLVPADGAAPDSPRRKRLFSNARAPARLHVALSPENIRPLLGHAREVGVRLSECVNEVRELLGGTS